MSIWTSWFLDLAKTEPVGLFVYIGCDDPGLLSALPLEQIDHVVVANCHPLMQDDLAEMSRGMTNLKTRPVAVTGDGDQASLYVTSLPGLSSLSEPKAIFDIFPNLQLSETVMVDALRLDALLEETPKREAGIVRLLRAELSGGEATILEALETLSDEKALDHVFLRVPGRGLYAGEDKISERLRAFGRADYELVSQSDDDPDFLEYWFRRSHQKIELRELSKAQAAAQDEANTLKAQLEDAKTTSHAALKDLEDKLEDARAALNQKTKRADELGRILSDYESRARHEQALKQQFEDAKTAAQAEADDFKQQLTDAKATAQAEADGLKQQLTDAKAAAQAEADDLKQQLTDAKAAGQAEADDLKQQLTDAKTAAQAEADDLRQQIEAANTASSGALDALQSKFEDANAALETKTKRSAELGRVLREYEIRARREHALRQQFEAENTTAQAELRSLEEQRDAVQAEVDSLKQQLTEANTAAQRKAHNLNTLLKDVERAAEAHQADASKTITTLKNKLAQSEKAREQALSRTQKIEAELTRAKETMAGRAEKAQKEIDTALRLQAMARADINDLRQRYEAVLSDRDTQDKLLQDIVTHMQTLLPAAKPRRAKATAPKKTTTRRRSKDRTDG